MNFKEMQKILSDQLDIVHLADIARELNVTPQVINNWKNRDKIPYKYVKKIRLIEGKNKIGEEIENGDINLLKSIWELSANSKKDDDEVNLKDDIIKLINLGMRIFSLHYKFIFLFTFSIVSFTIVYVLYFAPIVYDSTVTIIPLKSGKVNNNQISGLASQFGVNIGSSSTSDIGSANIIPDLVKSKSLLFALLGREFKISNKSEKITLLEHYYGQNSDFLRNKEYYRKNAVEILERKIKVKKNKYNDLLNITVSANENNLAANIATAVVEELDKIQKRITLLRVKEKLSYIFDRMNNISDDLINAEEELKTFRQSNRNISGSPNLLLEENRLEREVLSLNQIYTTLKSQYEVTRIEEIGSSTMIQTIDKAQAPIYRTSPKRTKSVLQSLIIGFLTSLLIIYFRTFYKEIYNSEEVLD